MTGPDGPVGGAVVRIERWVGSASGAIMTSTDGSGHFGAGGLLGGHYKVRAWKQPALATFDAATGFVPNGGRLQVNVVMEKHDAFTVQLAATSATASVGTGFGVAVLVTREQVDGNGVVVDGPVGGVPVKLSVDSAVSIDGDNPAKTDANGFATWTLTCQTAGQLHRHRHHQPRKGHRRAAHLHGGGTTTTTEPVTINLPIGGFFVTPDPGPYPAGTYTASSSDCAITYQVFVHGKWKDGHSSGDTLVLEGPGQDFVADQGTLDCTYTRIS